MGDATRVEPFERVSAGAAFLVNIHGKHHASLASGPVPRKAGRPLMKSQLLEHIRAELRTRLERLSKAACEADPEIRARG
jgi:hypothetical protein